jgi:starch phosphorylase
VFAGKSHPNDGSGKHLIREVYNLATDPQSGARIAFVEDYDMHIARYLAHGIDVWLNTPRRLNEACGTSGMKASLNGGLHFSILDGWWYEGYNGVNGWALDHNIKATNPEEEDKTDAQELYRLLEQEVVPLYYQQDQSGVPHGWVSIIKEAIRSVVPLFCTRRMLKEYTEKIYLTAAQSAKQFNR